MNTFSSSSVTTIASGTLNLMAAGTTDFVTRYLVAPIRGNPIVGKQMRETLNSSAAMFLRLTILLLVAI